MDDILNGIGKGIAQGIGTIGAVGFFLLAAWLIYLKWGRDSGLFTRVPDPKILGQVAGEAVKDAVTRVERFDDATERLIARIREEREPERDMIRDMKESIRRMEAALSATETRDMARDTNVGVGRVEKLAGQELEHLSNMVLNEARIVEVLERLEKSQAEFFRVLAVHAQTDEATGVQLGTQLNRLSEHVTALSRKTKRT